MNTTFSLADPNSPNPPPPPPPPGDDSPPLPEDTVSTEPPTGDFFPFSVAFGDFPFSETYSQQVPTAGSYSYQVTLSSRVYLGVTASSTSAGIGGVVITDSGGQALATSLPYDPSLGTLSAATAVATLAPGIYTIWVDMVNDFDGRSLTLSFFGIDPDGTYPPPPPPPTPVPSPPEEPDDDPVDDYPFDAVPDSIPSINGNGTRRNYIIRHTPTKESGASWMQTKIYYDGLGRLEEAIQQSASPAGYDLISYQGYDRMGRASHAWLPVVSDHYMAGLYLPFHEIRAKAAILYEGDTKPYSIPVYEDSPMDRVSQEYGPGDAWHGNRRSVRTTYFVNVGGNDTLDCVLYETAIVPFATDTVVTITNAGSYATAQLHVTRIADEDGNASFEFRDKRGRVVLVRAINHEDGVKEKLDTYYIYDNYGNKVAVLPPEASERLGHTGTWTNASSSVLRDYAYLYLYDADTRLIGKRQPGKDWTYYVYDKDDRLVFTQDGNLRQAGKWLFTLRDIFGRDCLTGLCSNTLDPFATLPIPSSVKVHREPFSGSTSIGHDYHLGGVTLSSPLALTVNYYDDYGFIGVDSFPDASLMGYDPSAEEDGFGRRHNNGPSSSTGMLTGGKNAKIGGGEVITGYDFMATYYDDRQRPVQIQRSNAVGFDTEYVAYNFVGKPTKMKRVYSVSSVPALTEQYTYTYDSYMRPRLTKHQLNDQPAVTIVDNEYDELGRLKANKRNGNANLRTDYTYNIRSWTKSIDGPLFSQTLYYNDARPDASNNPLYNGNISSMDWQVTRTDDNKQRGYNFAYDNLSRLTAADYREAGAASEKFSAAYSYDRHGNILNLQRHGNKYPDAYVLVDDVTFTYVGNQLVKATDAGENAGTSKSRDFKDTVDIAIEYTYDANGNMTMDGNNGIYSIAYNVLNLPKK
ncbi:MAG: DUF6443 domain-containing protein, partial [Mediterranea sp.]|nr:DUF6443 domain-containing protein [Mediterranea sp.]